MRVLASVILILVFALGWCGGSWFRQVRAARRLAKSRANWQLSELSSYYATLGALREGRTPNAVELLEFSVDCLVPTLRQKAAEGDPASRERILRMLKAVKLYRQRWPRQTHPDLLVGGQPSTADVPAAAEEAHKALEGL